MGESLVPSGLGQFGRLPREVRRQIYALSGLPSQEVLSLDARKLGLAVQPRIYSLARSAQDQGDLNDSNDSDDSEAPKSNPDVGFGSLVALLLTCRQLYDEISVILYAENKFIMQDHGVLKVLRPSSMKHLKKLCIILHVLKRPVWREIERQSPYPGHDTLLDPSSSEGRAILADWKETVRHLAEHVVPGRIDLELACEIAEAGYDDIMKAEQPGQHAADHVAQALEGLPPLAAFHLRLAWYRDAELGEMARLIAEKHMPKKHESAPFRFMDLPRELRLEILGHTDLVIPSRRVFWNALSGFSSSGSLVRGSSGQSTVPCRVSSGNGCFCRWLHAAWSPRCTCWTVPAPLFLVCRQMTDDARLVFYEENAIQVGWVPCSGIDFKNEMTLFFTHGILPETVGYLRNLGINAFKTSNDENNMEYRDRADSRWRTLRDEILRMGALNLRELRIRGIRQDWPCCEELEGETAEGILTTVREFVHQLIWPLDQDGIGPSGTQRLAMEIGAERADDGDHFGVRYVAEKTKRLESACDGEGWGSPVAARVTDGWCEEVYFTKERRTY